MARRQIVTLGVAFDSNPLKRGIDQANGQMDRLTGMSGKAQSAFQRLQGTIGNLVAGYVGFHTLNRVLGQTIQATVAGEQSQAKLESVLKATGFAAGRTAGQIDQLSTALSRSTLFDDDAIRDTAAILATFRRVQGQVFDEALRATLDLSQVLGQDLKSSAVQLGKALNDPLVGLTALRRVGVSFSAEQVALITGFAKTGDVASAQRVILQELAGEFGGAAAGANVGLQGAIRAARKEYDNFLESLGRTEQFSGVVGKFIRGWAEFWRKRELTTSPLEDLQIGLDRVQTRLEHIQRTFATGRMGLSPEGFAKVFSPIVAELVIQEDALKADIAALEGKATADERAATAAARHTQAQERLNQALKDATAAAVTGARFVTPTTGFIPGIAPIPVRTPPGFRRDPASGAMSPVRGPGTGVASDADLLEAMRVTSAAVDERAIAERRYRDALKESEAGAMRAGVAAINMFGSIAESLIRGDASFGATVGMLGAGIGGAVSIGNPLLGAGIAAAGGILGALFGGGEKKALPVRDDGSRAEIIKLQRTIDALERRRPKQITIQLLDSRGNPLATRSAMANINRESALGAMPLLP